MTPPPGGWSAGGLALYSALLLVLLVAERAAPEASAPLWRRLLWLTLEVALCFAVVRTHGTLIRPAFAYLVPACRSLPMFGERWGLLLGLLIWPAYVLNVGLDVWPDRVHEYPNYLLILLVVWAAAIIPVVSGLKQATARRAEGLYAELNAAHQELAALHHRAREAAVAEERNRLAREIHDTLAHYLTVVNVQLEAAEKLASAQPARSLEAVGRARRLTLQCLQEVRRSVGALRADTIEELALPRALAKLTREFAESTGIEVCLDLGDADAVTLTSESSQALYRTVQEGLTNVQRHAHAKRAVVRLAAPNGVVTLRVEDDGVGPGARGDGASDGGFGLVGLRERMALLGGQLDFGPGHNGGSALVVTLPIDAGRPEAGR